MANPEHVEILKQGVEAWNQWRKDNPDIEPDLSEHEISPANFGATCFPSVQDLMESEDDISNFNLNGMTDLEGINLENSNLAGTKFYEVNLNHSNLRNTVLVNAEIMNSEMIRAKLDFANCNEIMIERTNMARADLMGADFIRAEIQTVNLTKALMWETDFERAIVVCSNLTKAKMRGAWLWWTDLTESNLTETGLFNVKFSVRRAGKYKGVRLQNCHGNERFLRFVKHQILIEELQTASLSTRALVGIWAVLADCGRTPWAWIGWSMIFCLYYAGLYLGLGIEAFDFDTSLPFNFGSTLYYSIVTFTTLGFGDITPATGLAAFYVTLEVITGYVMLGGLISFIFSKLLPRG